MLADTINASVTTEPGAVERKSSTHKSEVVPVVMTKHPNADSLSVVQVFGWTCVVRSSDWEGVTKAAYIVPDSLVDVRRPEFTWLADKANSQGQARIKAIKLRGVQSYGMLVPVPESFPIGFDAAEHLGVTRYEPMLHGKAREKFIIGGEDEPGPSFDAGPTKYDLEAFERYHHLLQEGEMVELREKLDGSNCRYTYFNDRFWVKSRNRWVKRTPDYSRLTVESLVVQGCEPDKAVEVVARLQSKPKTINSFWTLLEAIPELMAYLQANPGTVVFGEAYGTIGRLRYGANRFAAFDVYKGCSFLCPDSFSEEMLTAKIPVAPELGVMRYFFDVVKKYSSGKTLAGPGIREGVVVKPISPRWSQEIGRVALKCVNPAFLEKDVSEPEETQE